MLFRDLKQMANESLFNPQKDLWPSIRSIFCIFDRIWIEESGFASMKNQFFHVWNQLFTLPQDSEGYQDLRAGQNSLSVSCSAGMLAKSYQKSKVLSTISEKTNWERGGKDLNHGFEQEETSASSCWSQRHNTKTVL